MIWDSSTKMISFPTILSYTGTERSKNMVGGITLQASLDKGIESKKQQIAQAEQWKKGLIQGLFV